MRAVVVGTIVMLSSATALAQESRSNAIEGSGKGYSTEIVVADVGAAIVIPAAILPTWSSNRGSGASR